MRVVRVLGPVPGWFLAYLVAAYVGRSTVVEGSALALLWPAAGVAALWAAARWRSHSWWLDMLALGGATWVSSVTTGATEPLAAVFVVVNVLQPCLFVILVRRLGLDVRGLGGTQPLARVEQLVTLCLAGMSACLAGAVMGTVGLRLIGAPASWQSLLAWWGRHSVGLLVVVLVYLVVTPALWRAWRHARGIRSRTWLPPTTRELVDAAVVVVLTAVVAVAVFSRNGEPLAFALLFMTVIAAVRTGPVFTAVHGTVSGLVVVGITLRGLGPFAQVEDPLLKAGVAQLFVILTLVTGLALAFNRSERDAAQRILVDERRDAADRAALLEAVLATMTEGISVIDETGRAVMRNPAGLRMLGLAREQEQEALDASRLHLRHLDGAPMTDAERPNARALQGETIRGVDFLQRLPGATEDRVLEVNATPLPPAHGVSQGPRAVIAFRDVTAERRNRAQLEAFAGVVAHDLGNPLSAIHGWVELLQGSLTEDEPDLDAARRSADRIDHARTQMQTLIDDLLAYAVSRDAPLELDDLDLSGLVDEVARLHREGPAAAVVTVQPGLRVRADRRLVRQLVANLLANAVKYVDEGTRPVIDVSGTAHGDRLEVRVADNGVGVPLAQRARIFEPFHRAHAGFSGTGLGLGICVTAVHRHGGSISVTDGPGGRGSTFVLDLPVA